MTRKAGIERSAKLKAVDALWRILGVVVMQFESQDVKIQVGVGLPSNSSIGSETDHGKLGASWLHPMGITDPILEECGIQKARHFKRYTTSSHTRFTCRLNAAYATIQLRSGWFSTISVV